MEHTGAQTLWRGLMIIESVVNGHRTLKDISVNLEMSKSTTHRLLTMLVHLKYLRQNSQGYSLGPRLIEYGMRSLSEHPLRAAAAPHIEELSRLAIDTVHLGIREEMEVLYIEKIAGSRVVEMNSRLGYRMPLDITGIGKALILDCNESELRDIHSFHQRNPGSFDNFYDEIKLSRKNGYALHCLKNDLDIRCVAAPVKDAANKIIAAISVAGISSFMTEERIKDLIPVVMATAKNISLELGWYERKHIKNGIHF